MGEENPNHAYLSASVVFTAAPNVQFAAIIVGVADPYKGVVKLTLLTPEGMSFPSQLFAFSALPTPGTWRWPDKSAPVLVAKGTELPPLQEV